MRDYLARTAPLAALAILIGVVVIAACNAVVAAGSPSGVAGYWDEYSAARILQVATPFLAYAILGIRKRGPWLVALALTLAAWGLIYLPEAATPGGGVDIGWAFLSILLPILIFSGGLLALIPDAVRGD
ncbi:hypothetical protein [Sphingomonas sp. G-3-2-10]|uniref:hypothetical protein n=1 Tax=Sphingomonas sp. G-3-2-10 TaxID=2728838 RepID=UPI00146BCCFB|nr:hypothetical protein [Sphingomonas sp. G-3-2-10]NML08476.1 hypothetical protein [Sphingomonas sp. G-3-2-10]